MKFDKLYCCSILLFCLINLLSCSKKKETHPLARAYGKELLWVDAEPFLKDTKNPEDSILRLKKIVAGWINEQIKLNVSSATINTSDPEIEDKIKRYKNDLLIYYYEQNKVAELLDTVVTESELKTLFENNRQNFHLSNNVVKLVFVKIKSDLKVVSKMRNLIGNFNEESKEKLQEMSNQYAENSFLEEQVWLNFDDITKELPIKTYDAEQFLENNKYVEIKEGPYIYLINILAYQIKNSGSNFEFERDNIKKVILQNRKNILLRQLEITLKKEAELKNEVENFVN